MLVQLLLLLHLFIAPVTATHMCKEQTEIIAEEDFRYKKVGYNTKNTFILERGGTCQFNFDKTGNPKFFMVAEKYLDENED